MVDEQRVFIKTAAITNLDHQAPSEIEAERDVSFFISLLHGNAQNRLHGNFLFLAEPR